MPVIANYDYASTNAWYNWNQTYTSTATAITNQYVWAQWNGTATSTATAISAIDYSNTWNGWNAGYQGNAINQQQIGLRQQRIAQPYPANVPAVEADNKKADERALALLKKHLSEAQRAEFEKLLRFTVVAPSGKQYQIRSGWAQNIDEVDDKGKRVANLCAHPDHMVPIGDNLLAQKLMLECDEANFLRIANRRAVA